MRFDQFNNPRLMFRDCAGSLFFGGSRSQSSSSQTSNTSISQEDSRVGAADNGIAVGQGGTLDQSFTDASRTELSVVDASDRSFTDNSSVAVNTYDQSTHYTLDAEVAKAAIVGTQTTFGRAADVLEKQITENTAKDRVTADLIKTTNTSAIDLAATALEKSIEDAANAREQTTGFLSAFYRDKEDATTKTTND